MQFLLCACVLLLWAVCLNIIVVGFVFLNDVINS